MPAPSSESLKAYLKSALISEGIYQKGYNSDGQLIENQSELPPEMDKVVNALSRAITDQWAEWQIAQQVLIPVTASPGSPSTGKLP